MKANVLNECADNPRARRGIIRAIRFTLPFFMCVSLAFAPFSAKLTNSGLCVEKSEAKANPVVVAGATGFIEAAATAAGLSSAEFVATIAGITATGVGMNIASESGISMGYTFSHNINSLLDAGDYTPYENLSQEQQEAWGSQENYNSAKLNSLMDAFDLGDARDRFYSSGGVDFDSDELAILDKLGRIGDNWAIRTGNAYEDIKGAITNPKVITEYLGKNDYWTFDMSNAPNYPSSYPVNVYINKTDNAKLRTSNNSYDIYTSNEVYMVAFYTNNTNTRAVVYEFDKVEFGYSNTPSGYNSATKYTYNDNDYYRAEVVSNMGREISFENLQGSGSVPYYYSFDGYIPYILFNADLSGNPGVDVPEYPTEPISNLIPVYFPEQIEPDTTWIEYTTEPEPLPEPITRPDNIYNPENLTGTQQWREETESNVLPLQNIKFDKLFPFCLLTDVKDLSEKIDNTITPGEQSDYKKLNIPMAYASDGQGGFQQEDIELDGQPLYDLLVMAKPFNQIMLLFFLVFSLVMFWKSILTGD